MNDFISASAKKGHKLKYACLSKCLTWSLSITLKSHKTSLSYQYLSKSSFVRKTLNEAITELNDLDSTLSIPKCPFQAQEEPDKEMSNLKFLSFPIENQPTFYQSEKRLTLLANDSEDNFTFVIPIDLENNPSSPKDQIKLLKDINNSFLTREIFCNLNGNIHNQKLLSRDIQFIIEPKRLVKSIQFKIEKFKNNWLKNGTDNWNKQLKTNFFTMIIDNQSIGIEFMKRINNFETLPTNFNSIVNCGFSISRIFILIPISKSILFPKTMITKELEAPIKTETEQKQSKSKLSLQKIFSPKNLIVNYNYTPESPEITNMKRNKFNQFNYSDYVKEALEIKKPLKDLRGLNGKYQTTYCHDMMTSSNHPYMQKYWTNYNSINQSTEIKRVKSLNIGTNHKVEAILNEYSPTCNYLLFLKQCSLMVQTPMEFDYYQMKLKYFFNAFNKVSLFGLDVHYISDESDTKIEKVTYFPTLSSMTISITDQEVIEAILKEISIKKIRQSPSDKSPSVKSSNEDLENENKTNCSEAYTEYFIFEGLKVIVGQDSIKIEFIESRPPYVRNMLSQQISKCISSLKSFESINIDKVVNNSWFCVSWNPLRINKEQRLQKTIFLSYYQFKLSSEDMNSGDHARLYKTIPPIGVLPIKYEESQWLTQFGNPQNQLSSNGANVNFDLLINRAMTNVEEYVYLNANQISIDYDFYLKSMMTKQNTFTHQNHMLNTLTECI